MSTKNIILIKNKYFFIFFIFGVIIENYLRINKEAEFNTNKVHKMIVKLGRIFSGHLLVISFIPQLILLRFKAVHLFCIKTTNISKIAITISVNFKVSIIFFIYY
ncbi:hypothetical protein DLH72_02070 [Candidatus Gracilibacteria bacterium]|nr:MAG: hypothetical protein DLH72_02070 [Candidatus Gracilibacteria bacterium]